jgi:hypothetical protein
MPKLFFELKMTDEWGRVHGVIRREIDDRAAYIGPRVVDDMRAGVLMPGHGQSTMDATIEVMQAREFRRSLLKHAATQAGGQLADFLEDREGWHGIERQERTEKIATDNRN